MVRTARILGAAAALVFVAACSAGNAGPVPQPTPAAPTGREADPTTADGIYTLAQAERGADLFRGLCSECHDVSDWTDPAFKRRWATQSVFQLWYFINDRMPYEDPWTLSRQQVTDALAYILNLNGLPAGDMELATDDDSIDDYWIEWLPQD